MRLVKILFSLLLFISSTNLMAKSHILSPVQKKKQAFLKLMVPAINNVYQELQTTYIETQHYINMNHRYHKIILSAMKKLYNVKTNDELLMRLKPHPRSIALAQAAMESSWATSRFFRQANNIFGVWSFNKNEPRIAASKTRGTKIIWLKKYNTIEDSIRDYYRVLARGRAFKEFRKLKMKTDNPFKLVKKLDRYSELGAKYGKELSLVISYNKFYLYDK